VVIDAFDRFPARAEVSRPEEKMRVGAEIQRLRVAGEAGLEVPDVVDRPLYWR
jgi:hypothetical protein